MSNSSSDNVTGRETHIVRIMFFPERNYPNMIYPERNYPNMIYDDNDKCVNRRIFHLKLKNLENVKFKGFVGSKVELGENQVPNDIINNSILIWNENLEKVIMTHEEVANSEGYHAEEHLENPEEYGNVTLEDVITCINDNESSIYSKFTKESAIEEVVDWRVYKPSPLNFDDETTGIASAEYVSANLRQDSYYDRCISEVANQSGTKIEEDLSNDRTKEGKAENSKEEDGSGLSTQMIGAEVTKLFQDEVVMADPEEDSEDHKVAAALRLVMEFEVTVATGTAIDIDQIIDTKNTEDSKNIMCDKEAALEKAEKNYTYTMFSGCSAQTKDGVAIPWEFTAFDNKNTQVKSLFEIYSDVDHFEVTRSLCKLDGQRTDFIVIDKIRPNWLISNNNGLVKFIRPQFQFVDRQIDDISNYQYIYYTIVARGIKNEILASTTVIHSVKVIKPIEPLQPLSVILESPNSCGNNEPLKLNILVPFNSKNEEQNMESNSDDVNLFNKLWDDKICIRYRKRKSQQLGIYGIADNQEPVNNWSGPSANNSAIRFSEAPRPSPLLWDETKPIVDLKDNDILKVERSVLKRRFWDQENRIERHEVIGFAVVISLKKNSTNNSKMNDLFNILTGGESLAANEALEFFAGRKGYIDGKVCERSVLTRCRHGLLCKNNVKLINSEKKNNDFFTTKQLFAMGNTVSAFERISDSSDPGLKAFVEKDKIKIESKYEEIDSQIQVALDLTWVHDISGLSNISFNPVVGYDVYYNPIPIGKTNDVLDNMDIYRQVDVMPEQLYRLSPDQIVPTIQLDENGNPILDKDGNFIWDWRQPSIEKYLSNDDIQFPPIQSQTSEFPTIEYEPGYIDIGECFRISKLLMDFVEQLVSMIHNVQPVYNIKNGVYDMGSGALSKKESEQEERWNSFKQTMEDKEDNPYHWRSLEAIGMSVELRFETKSGAGFSLKDWLSNEDHGRKLNLLCKHYGVSVLFFQSQEGVPYLDTVRLIQWVSSFSGVEADEGKLIDVGLKLLDLKLNGRSSQEPKIDKNKKPWITSQLNEAIEECKFSGEEKAITFRRISTDNKPIKYTAPITRNGTINMTIPLDHDKFARTYGIAIKMRRRYDEFDKAFSTQQGQINTFSIKDNIKSIQIDRVAEVTPPILLARPLVGGVQAFVYQSSTAVSASASTISAFRSQFSGSHISLKREDPDHNVIQNFYASGNLNWEEYSGYAKKIEQESNNNEPPSVLPESAGPESAGPVNDKGEWHDSIIKPLKYSQKGEYGVDVYNFPHLPPYYRFFTEGYTTAGRVSSIASQSQPEYPLLESFKKDQKNQQSIPEGMPPMMKIEEEEETKKKMIIHIPLVHFRHHLPENIRCLWIESDAKIRLGGNDINYGSLPDKDLVYQLYALLGDPGLTPDISSQPNVYVPICMVEMQKQKPDNLVATTNPMEFGCYVKIQHNEVSIPSSGFIQIKDEVDEKGKVFIGLELELSGTSLPSIFRQTENFNKLYLVVGRKGAWSDFIQAGELTDKLRNS